MTKIVSKIIHITDMHIFSDQRSTLLGINTYSSFVEVIKDITINLHVFQPDFIIITGDISQDFSIDSYKNMEKLFFDFPGQFAATLGNHDSPAIFAANLEYKNMNHNKSFITKNWKIIILNSHWSNHISGKLPIDELEFLRIELDADTDKNIIVFLHHHVLPIDSNWIDKISLSNTQQFLEIIDRYDNIKAVVSGHVHQDSLRKRNNIEFITTPATSWQFMPLSYNFGLDDLMPGYRRIVLYDDNSFTNETIRLPYNEKFLPDRTSKGY